MKRLTLKTKLLMLLVLLTSAFLSIYAYIAVKDFEHDKIAYVKDVNLSEAISVADKIRLEVEVALEKVQFLLRGYTSATGFHQYNKLIFESEQIMDWLVTFQKKKGQYAVFKNIEARWKCT